MDVLVDSNIFLDYYLNRSDGVTPLGEFAFQFIKETIGCKHSIAVLCSVLNELKEKTGLGEKGLNEKVFCDLIEANKFRVIEENKGQVIKARKISIERKLPVVDCVQAVIANEENLVIVSRDFHFIELDDLAKARKPEEL